MGLLHFVERVVGGLVHDEEVDDDSQDRDARSRNVVDEDLDR